MTRSTGKKRAPRPTARPTARQSRRESPGAYASPPCLLHEFESGELDAGPGTGIAIKRIHEKPAPTDGRRLLVDRLWPRGIRKADAALDDWRKDLAPSPALRQWFGHDPERFAEFRRRYRAELKARAGELRELARQARTERITLLYAARDPVHNHARVLAEVLAEALTEVPPARKTRRDQA